MSEMASFNIEVRGDNLGLGVCLECIGSYKLHMDDVNNMANEVPPPPLFFAITTAPSWQMQNFGGQNVVACVPSPSCMSHLGVKPLTPQQKASQSGLIIPGGSG